MLLTLLIQLEENWWCNLEGRKDKQQYGKSVFRIWATKKGEVEVRLHASKVENEHPFSQIEYRFIISILKNSSDVSHVVFVSIVALTSEVTRETLFLNIL